MENKFILLLIECPESDNQCYQTEAERIIQVVRVDWFSEKNACTEHLGYRIERICHKNIVEYLVVEVKLLNGVENRGHVVKKGTEYFIEILDILKENLTSTKDKSYTE